MKNRQGEDNAAYPPRDQLLKELADLRRQLSENKARVEELREANRELDALTRVTDYAISTLDIRELVDLLLGRLVEIIGADAGTILVKYNDELRISSSIGMGNQEATGQAGQPGQDFTRLIMSTDRPLYIADVQRDARITDPFIRGRGIRTMLGVPLRYREKAVGVLLLLWFEVHGENPRDIRLLEVTADRSAMAINNALLFDRVQQARAELEGRIRERTAELSDVVRDLNLEAEVRRRTEISLRLARREINFYFDLMGRDIGERDQAALRALERVVDRMNSAGRLEKGDGPLLAEAMHNIEGSVQITRNVRILRQAVAERQNPQTVDLREMLREVVARFSGARGGDVTISLRMSRACEMVGCKVAATGLHRELYENIIRNAIERSSGHLTINISLSAIRKDGENLFRVVIEDDGPGIPDDLKRRIFETGELDIAEKRVEGLGLYVVRMLVESAGGTVSVEDRMPGDYKKGSRFIVMMPAKYGGM